MQAIEEGQSGLDDEWEIIKEFMESVYLPELEDKLKQIDEVKSLPRDVFQSLYWKFTSVSVPQHSQIHKRLLSKPDSFALILSHECRAQACSDGQYCPLCEQNPNRRCGSKFLHEKYAEDGPLLSRCGQPLIVHLKNKTTGEVVKNYGQVIISLVDGQEYDRCFGGQNPSCAENFDSCIATVREGKPLLDCAPSSRIKMVAEGVCVALEGGVAKLPRDLRTTSSSISFFNNKKGSYRILVRAAEGFSFSELKYVDAYASPKFMTLTKKGMAQQKKGKPLKSDDIEKLEKMGRERGKKFKSLGSHVSDTSLPSSVETVEEFQHVSRKINNNGVLKQQILSTLKISEEDWALMCEHALRAVEHDTRLRFWDPEEEAEVISALIYKSNAAEIDLDSGPAALIIKNNVVLRQHWESWQFAKAKDLNNSARRAWWEHGHPGWKLMHVTVEQFEKDPSALERHLQQNLVGDLSRSLELMSLEEGGLPSSLCDLTSDPLGGELPPYSQSTGIIPSSSLGLTLSSPQGMQAMHILHGMPEGSNWQQFSPCLQGHEAFPGAYLPPVSNPQQQWSLNRASETSTAPEGMLQPLEHHSALSPDLGLDSLTSVGQDVMLLSNSFCLDAELKALHDKTFPCSEIGDLQ